LCTYALTRVKQYVRLLQLGFYEILVLIGEEEVKGRLVWICMICNLDY